MEPRHVSVTNDAGHARQATPDGALGATDQQRALSNRDEFLLLHEINPLANGQAQSDPLRVT